MESAHRAATQMATDVRLGEAEKLGAREVDPSEYQAIVRSLMYVALAMRPDISFVVSALSRHNSCPRTTHLTADQASPMVSGDDLKQPLTLLCPR